MAQAIPGLKGSISPIWEVDKNSLKVYFLLEIFTLICRFIVIQNRVMKYMTRMGQKTGMLKKSKNVQTKAMTVAFVAEYQNLNSGNLNIKFIEIIGSV